MREYITISPFAQNQSFFLRLISLIPISSPGILRFAGTRVLLPLIFLYSANTLRAQLSPGDLSAAHSHLEGLSNCTRCHVLGEKVSNDKCLECHGAINDRIKSQKGYHSSSVVRGKECLSCHSEHNGRNFQLIRLDTTTFDHSLTGYPLSVPHSKTACRNCHNPSKVKDPALRNKKGSFLGAGTTCLDCHEDYHLRTLSGECLSCHVPEFFSPASKFDHNNARFRLAGKHRSVSCSRCHKTEQINGRKFQQFRGVAYVNCTSCHKDPHEGKFGENCRQCHSEESFQMITGTRDFDHNATGYRLEGKHLIVNCSKCHKTRYTDPLKYGSCRDCHSDYHKGQFEKNGLQPDCSDCHSLQQGFSFSSFSFIQHNQGNFKLAGAHLAVPCFECHRKKDVWSFRDIGKDCRDCHTDIHKTYISSKFYPDGNCRICHTEEKWNLVHFDHNLTSFPLDGAHGSLACRNCHFKNNGNGNVQKFSGLENSCSSCHPDPHSGQFTQEGDTPCQNCHRTGSWKLKDFDHDKTNFPLEGMHAAVACYKCHKPVNDNGVSYTLYKIRDYRCESCHK